MIDRRTWGKTLVDLGFDRGTKQQPKRVTYFKGFDWCIAIYRTKQMNIRFDFFCNKDFDVEKGFIPSSTHILTFWPEEKTMAGDLKIDAEKTEYNTEAELEINLVLKAIKDPTLAPTLSDIEWAAPIMERLLK